MIGKLGKEVKALKKILIVEDDQLLNRTLAYNLTSDGYEVISVFNFDSAVRKLRENEFDVALLDINLPDGSGLDLCEEIRNRGQHTYIIFITANDKESDMLKGYEVGGADYVTKPFSVTVLCKKVAAVFANLELRTPRHDLFDDGFLKIDFSEQSASLAGESLDFTPKEYRTLFLFVKNPRIILTKRQILEKLWDIDGDFVDEHTLTTIISRIRKKIETDERKYIKTAYGMGYQWIGGGTLGKRGITFTMKLQNLSVRAFLRKIVAGTLLTAALLLLIFFLLTKDVRVVICGIILTAAFYIWGMVFLHYFQKKLSLFTDGLCQTLDHMMDSTDRPQVDYEAETLLSRISHRLERLYNVMQKTRHTAEGEKEELQSLVSDISHQTKTPIANLKLINDTMLTRPLTEEKRKEFLQATGTQLDKLDFLIQGMVKTSRLETGVITLEKQDAVIGDTLVSAINGVLAPMEQKEISLSVDCPSDLTISHDSRWTSEALFNILDNAVKYTSAGGSIQVRVRDWEMYLRIDVTDTGRGIPEHSQGTIFKRFYRDEAVHDIDGVGIGLYLAREIITMQGGYITVESKVGEGSTFSVFLPIK